MEGNVQEIKKLTGKIKTLAIDKTLKKEGMCADAKAVGDRLDLMNESIYEAAPSHAKNIMQDNERFNSYKLQGALNNLLNVVGGTSKQLIPQPYLYDEKTLRGVTYTPCGNGAIILNGSSDDGWSHYSLFHYSSHPLVLTPGKYILTGVPEELRGVCTLKMYSSNSPYDYDNAIIDSSRGVEFELDYTGNFSLDLNVEKEYSFHGEEIKPMIRDASVDSSKFEKYIPNLLDRFYVSDENDLTESFEVPINRSCILIATNSSGTDMFVVTNFRGQNDIVVKITNNTSIYVHADDGYVNISGNGDVFTYSRIMI